MNRDANLNTLPACYWEILFWFRNIFYTSYYVICIGGFITFSKLKTAVRFLTLQPQGSRFASLAAKINSWEEEAKISADANPLNAAPSSNDRPPTGVSGKPSPFESPVARVQQRLSVNSSSTPNAARGIQFGARPVAPPSNSGGVDAAPSKPPRIPDSPSRTGHGTSSHEPGVFQSPPRSSAMNVKPPSPSQSKLLTTKPVSPKMKALQVGIIAISDANLRQGSI